MHQIILQLRHTYKLCRIFNRWLPEIFGTVHLLKCLKWRMCSLPSAWFFWAKRAVSFSFRMPRALFRCDASFLGYKALFIFQVHLVKCAVIFWTGPCHCPSTSLSTCKEQ